MCQVLPAHGAGSPCGKNISKDLYSTIGKEKATNAALSFTNVSVRLCNTVSCQLIIHALTVHTNTLIEAK